MKLVDILARELKVWPCETWAAVGQSNYGSLHEIHPPASKLWWTAKHYQMADDWAGAEVTRAQWQAAVDSLKAAENSAPEWNGEGLPPVGIDAEVLFDSQPKKYVGCKVLAHDEGRAVYRFTTGSRKGEYGSDLIYFTSGNKIPMFRPIRTPEQIAIEVRSKAITQLMCDLDVPTAIATRAYDKGYRKLEIVDN